MADHVVTKIISLEDAAALESLLQGYPPVPIGTLRKMKLIVVFDELPNIGPE